MVCKRFKFSDVTKDAERKRQTISQSIDDGVSSSPSIFCVFIQNKGENGAPYSEMKIKKYDYRTNRFDETVKISLGFRTGCNVILNAKKVFILGGGATIRSIHPVTSKREHLKSVSNVGSTNSNC